MSENLQFAAKENNGNILELAFTGQLESIGAEYFKTVCQEYLAKGIRHVLADLSGVNVISSSGIGALMVTQEDFQANGGMICYVSMSKEVHSVIRLMDLESILNIADNQAEALQKF